MSAVKENILAQDFKGISKEDHERIEKDIARKTYSNGLYNSKLIEPVPNYHQAGCEVVNFEKTGRDAAKNNCWIILGRDRENNPNSGYGGKGHTQAGAIYICAGMSSARPYAETPPPPERRADANASHPGLPNSSTYDHAEALATPRSFSRDASSIYISQRCDLDGYYELGGNSIEAGLNPAEYKQKRTTTDTLKMTKYNTLKADNMRAGIGIKSDNVRLVGRESIRLQVKPEANSLGGPPERSFGISLVGGGDATKTHPIPLGYKLIGSFEHLKEAVDSLSSCVNQFITDQTIFNQIMTHHVHVGFGGQISSDTIAPIRTMLSQMAFKTFNISYKHLLDHGIKMGTFLSDYTKPGNDYILSQNNFCD